MDETNEEIPQEKPEEKKQWSNWGLSKRWGHGQGQPSPEAKKAGWAKKKRNRELAQQLLGMKFIGLVPIVDDQGRPCIDPNTGKQMTVLSDYAEKLKNYFGLTAEQIEEMDNETAIMLRQIGMAIEKGDNTAAELMMQRAYGKPKEFNPMDDVEDGTPIINIQVVTQIDSPEILENEIPKGDSTEAIQ